jgi:hypothetical protein
LKAGLEDLAARRAELYALHRNVLKECGEKWGWSDGWDAIPLVDDDEGAIMETINLDENQTSTGAERSGLSLEKSSMAGIDNGLLRAALDNKEDFYRLYEILTDKALRHYTVAGHTHAVQANMTDLAVLKLHLGDYSAAAGWFSRTTTAPFFGDRGWSLLELSMLLMYSRCLRELQRKDEYVKVMLKLLGKACNAEKERLKHRTSSMLMLRRTEFPRSAMRGFLNDLFSATQTLSNEIKVPVSQFFTAIELDGSPVYQENCEGWSLAVRMRSLLVDDIDIEKVRVRLSSSAQTGLRELWLESPVALAFKPGMNKFRLVSNVREPHAQFMVTPANAS